MFSAAHITATRKSKGFSQELLAERSGVSLRTIQRVEQGETVPRGHTVQALATALEVPLDAWRTAPELPQPAQAAAPAQPALRSDPDFLQLLNLSALSFLALPFLNIVVPLLLWRARRHRIEHVAAVGRRVLGFQILWQLGSFFAYLLAVLAQLVVARRYNIVLPGLFIGLLVFTYAANALTVGYYALRLRAGHLDVYPVRL